MLTANSIQKLGYTQKESYSIMHRLKVLGCTVTSVRLSGEYNRNGTICHYIQYCDAIDHKEALELLGGYMIRLPKECNREKWSNILKDLKEAHDMITQEEKGNR